MRNLREEFNYVLNMVTAWAKYITGEQIPGLDSRFLRISQNLADVSKATARTNLDVWSKTESDTRYVNVSGDTMTGTCPCLVWTSKHQAVTWRTSRPQTQIQTGLTGILFLVTTRAPQVLQVWIPFVSASHLLVVASLT